MENKADKIVPCARIRLHSVEGLLNANVSYCFYIVVKTNVPAYPCSQSELSVCELRVSNLQERNCTDYYPILPPL